MPEVGFYKVDYGVYVSSSSTANDYVVLFLNGAEVNGTERGLENNLMVNASAIIETIVEGSTLGMQIQSASPITFLDDDGINGYMVITKIG